MLHRTAFAAFAGLIADNVSTILRDMMHQDPSSEQTVSLLHTDLETEQRLQPFLLLMEHRPTDFNALLLDRYAAVSVARLLVKYDCACLRDVLRLHLRIAMQDAEALYNVFEVAATINDPELCRDAIPSVFNRTWVSEVGEGMQLHDQIVHDASALDVGAWSEQGRLDYPDRYVTALLRAGRKRSTKEGTHGDWQAVAKEFYRLVAAN
jgi:hypothetical protein